MIKGIRSFYLFQPTIVNFPYSPNTLSFVRHFLLMRLISFRTFYVYCHSAHSPNKLNELKIRINKSALSTRPREFNGQFHEKIEWSIKQNTNFNFRLTNKKKHICALGQSAYLRTSIQNCPISDYSIWIKIKNVRNSYILF